MAILTGAGRDILTNRIKGSGTEPNWTAWGTGSTAEASGQTALVTPAAEARVSGTSTRVSSGTYGANNDIYQVVGTITSASGQTITEMGLFDAVTAGNMLIRAVFTGLPLSNGDSIQFTVKLTFS